MNMIVSAAVMSSAVAIGPAQGASSEVGATFEKLFIEYAANMLEWARLHRAGKDEHFEKFGSSWDMHSEDGRAIFRVFEKMLSDNGCEQVSDRNSVLFDTMSDLSETIKQAPIADLNDLRSRTLVALWEALPTFAYNDGDLDFHEEYDGGAIRSMFDAAVSLTGLQPLVNDLEQKLATAAARSPDDVDEAAPQGEQNVDPVFDLIEGHRATDEALNRMYESVKGKDLGRAEDDLLNPLWESENAALDDLVSTVPETLSGVAAWVSYLSGIMEADGYRMDERHFAVFLPNLSEALNA